jgi:putative ABC transport system permease protein
MTTVWSDIRYGVRILLRQPLFALVALLTLALGIGANLTIFSFVNAFLLRPLPYPEAERFVRFRPVNQTFGAMSIAYPNFQDWQKLNQTFETMACYRYDGLNLTGTDQPECLDIIQASANLLPMLGTQPALGRLFDPNDDHGQAQRTVVLSHGLWQRRFSSDPDVVGRPLLLDGEPYTIVGVLPADLSFPPLRNDRTALWMPIGLLERHEWFMRRGNHPGTSGLGKLKAGITLAQARSDMRRVAEQLTRKYPNVNTGNTVEVDDYHAILVRRIRPSLLVLMSSVGCVLLIVCVNIAGLLLVRAASRTQEFSVRTALGTGRLRIARQLLCENMILAVLGGLAGLLVAHWGTHLLAAMLGDTYGLNQGRPPLFDRNMLLFFLGITLSTGLLFGLFPAFQSSLVTVSAAIRGGTRTATSSRRHHRLRDVLVVAEIALALVLLTGAGLLVRSLQHYLQADPGYNPDSALTMQISLPDNAYDNDRKKCNFYRGLLARVRPLPGVKHVGLCSNLLGRWQSDYRVEGAPEAEPGQAPHAECCEISSDFIEAMGMRLIAGRTITERDTSETTPVTLIDERFVQRWWPHENPLDHHIRMGGTLYQVVGVVSHVKHYGIDRSSRESMYIPMYQSTCSYPTLVVRCQGDPLRLVAPLRQAIAQVDPDLAPAETQTLQAIVDRQSFMRRFLTTVLGVFAGTALLLAALGIYGVTAYAVSQRTQEFGIRMALGGHMRDILRLVLGRGCKLALIGVTIGLIASFSLSWLIRGLLFGVTAWDPLTFIAVTFAMASVVLLACLIPARRAARVDPMEALRYE